MTLLFNLKIVEHSDFSRQLRISVQTLPTAPLMLVAGYIERKSNRFHRNSPSEMNVWFGAFCNSAVQRYRPFAAKSKIGLSSPQQSLAVLVQFRDLSIAKSRNQTFVGENQLLKLANSIAAIAVSKICDLTAPKL